MTPPTIDRSGCDRDVVSLFFDTSRTPTAFFDSTWGANLAEWHLSTLPKTSMISKLGSFGQGSTVQAFFARVLLNSLASFGILFVFWLMVVIYSLIRNRRLSQPMAVVCSSVVVYLALGDACGESDWVPIRNAIFSVFYPATTHTTRSLRGDIECENCSLCHSPTSSLDSGISGNVAGLSFEHSDFARSILGNAVSHSAW